MSASEKFFVDENGVFLGCFWGGEPEVGTQVPSAPLDARQIWNFSTGEYGPVPAPEPVEPYLNNGGLIRFSGNPAVVAENIRMGGATRIRKGVFRAYHEEAYPNNQYSVTPSVFDANRCSIQATARTATYIEVRVWDAAGALYDPAEITVKTERVIT